MILDLISLTYLKDEQIRSRAFIEAQSGQADIEAAFNHRATITARRQDNNGQKYSQNHKLVKY